MFFKKIYQFLFFDAIFSNFKAIFFNFKAIFSSEKNLKTYDASNDHT